MNLVYGFLCRGDSSGNNIIKNIHVQCSVSCQFVIDTLYVNTRTNICTAKQLYNMDSAKCNNIYINGPLDFVMMCESKQLVVDITKLLHVFTIKLS